MSLGQDQAQNTEASSLYLISFCMLSICTNVWARLVLPYSGFPWKLAALANPGLTDAEADSIVNEFLRAGACCLDTGFSARLRRQVSNPSDLKRGGRLFSVVELLTHQKVLNAKIEDTFARHNSVAQAARGHIQLDLTPEL